MTQWGVALKKLNKLFALFTLVILISGCGTSETRDEVVLQVQEYSQGDHAMWLTDNEGGKYVIDEPALSDWGLTDALVGNEIKVTVNEFGEILEAVHM